MIHRLAVALVIACSACSTLCAIEPTALQVEHAGVPVAEQLCAAFAPAAEQAICVDVGHGFDLAGVVVSQLAHDKCPAPAKIAGKLDVATTRAKWRAFFAKLPGAKAAK